jgi:chemotaxis protein MotB
LARKKKPPEHVNHERWLVSYADFVTLLFAFFTSMYAISNVDAQKAGKMVLSMRASFDNAFFAAGSPTLSLSQGTGTESGSTGGAKSIVQNVRAPKEAGVREAAVQRLDDLKTSLLPKKDVVSGERAMGRLQRNVESLVGAEALKSRVRTRLEGRGLVISLGEGGFFDSGSDQMKPEGRALLDTIATGLVPLGNLIRVEGHTDNVPIKSGKFPSNWELSTARATSIVAYLVAKFGLPPERLSAAGYAEFHPTATNDTDEGRGRNRRVDLVVLNPSSAQLEPR